MATYIIKKNNVFTMNRGDSAKMEFCTDIEIPEGISLDRLYLGICEPNQWFEHALIKKTFTLDPYEETDIPLLDIHLEDDGKYSFSIPILPEDTVDIIPGEYYYEVKCTGFENANLTGNEKPEDTYVTTIVQRTKFIIVE